MASVTRVRRRVDACSSEVVKQSLLEEVNVSNQENVNADVLARVLGGYAGLVRVLRARFTEIDSLNGLRPFTLLSRLCVSHAKLSRLDGVEALVNLRELDCAHNSITGLDPLLACDRISTVWAQHNNIKMVPVDLERRLQHLELVGNPLQEEPIALKTVCDDNADDNADVDENGTNNEEENVEKPDNRCFSTLPCDHNIDTSPENDGSAIKRAVSNYDHHQTHPEQVSDMDRVSEEVSLRETWNEKHHAMAERNTIPDECKVDEDRVELIDSCTIPASEKEARTTKIEEERDPLPSLSSISAQLDALTKDLKDKKRMLGRRSRPPART